MTKVKGNTQAHRRGFSVEVKIIAARVNESKFYSTLYQFCD